MYDPRLVDSMGAEPGTWRVNYKLHVDFPLLRSQSP